jgi:serine carboxypeptidase-like 19/serine carboxypeptidase-like clade 1
MLGNPVTTRREDNDKIQYAHGMGLISDELYAVLFLFSLFLDKYGVYCIFFLLFTMMMFPLEFKQSLQKNCKGEYIDVDSRNELCLRDLQYFDEASNTIIFVSILSC